MRADLADEQLQPVYMTESSVYHPLVTNAMCLLCHGQNLAPGVAELLVERYPGDRATGYAPNELRGAIKVVFEE